jgi:hypothetical protein
MWPSPSWTRPAISSHPEERFTKRPLFAGNVAALDEYQLYSPSPPGGEGRMRGHFSCAWKF